MADSVSVAATNLVVERQAAYRLLGSMFLYPSHDRIDEIQRASLTLLQNGGFLEIHSSERFDTLMRSYIEAVELGQSSYVNDYHRLFHINPAAPPYASTYLDPSGFNRAWILVQLEQLYARSGLTCTTESNDPPDHLAVHLEFMSFLCSMEAAASSSEESDNHVLLQQRDFVQKHLASWVPKFIARVRNAAPCQPFGDLVTSLEGLVAEDLLRLRDAF